MRAVKALGWLLVAVLLVFAGVIGGVLLAGWSGSPEKQLLRLARPLKGDGLGGLTKPQSSSINDAFAAIESRYKRDHVGVDRTATLRSACVVECALMWNLTVRTTNPSGGQLPEGIYLAIHANLEPYPADARAMITAPSPYQWREKTLSWTYTRRYGPGVQDHVKLSGDYGGRRPDAALADEKEIAAVLNVMGERLRSVIEAENEKNALMPKGSYVVD